MLFFLSVPLVAEGVDLVGKPGKVFVGPSLVVLDDPQQALACADQALENRGGAAGTLTGPMLDPHSYIESVRFLKFLISIYVVSCMNKISP